MQQGLQEPKQVFRTSNGTELIVIAGERANAMRRSFSLLVGEQKKRPEPVHAIRDFERGRPLSFEKFVQVQTAVLRKADAPSVLRYFGRELSNACAHLVAPCDHLDDVLDVEADFQHDADKQQRRLSLYIATSNRVGIERVRDTAASHALALGRVVQTADNALRAPVTPRGRHVVHAMGANA